MNGKALNRMHQNALVTRVRELTREITALLAAGDLQQAAIKSEHRKTYASMAMASLVSVDRLSAAMR